ncbi:MAG: efflux RND transporter periplasmic adaptor subunit [Gemmatimonadaceae bacterium]
MTMPSLLRRIPIVRTLCCVAAVAFITGCGGGPVTEAAAAETATETTPPLPPRDTAALSAEAVELAGITLASARSFRWREAWTAPARIVLDPAVTHLLGAVAEGRVSRVLASVGDRVVAGQPLVAIHSHEMTDARSAVAGAAAADAGTETALVVARSAAARAERLLAIRALSLADAERARADVAQAEARHAQARAELARAGAMLDHLGGTGDAAGHEVLVRSPVEGVVVSREAQPGVVVLVGAPLLTVSQATSLLVAMQLPEHAAGAALPGATVRFGVPALPEERFEALVERVAPTIDSVTRTIAVLARPVGNVGVLRAGMYGAAELLGAPGAGVLVVPAASVQAMEGDTVVVTARERPDGLLLEAVRVRVGRRTAELAEILAGLAPGTPVVARGAAVAKAEILRRRGEE